MLEVNSISYSYSRSFGLKNISFQLEHGETLGIIGESGCGKTTLLKLLFGELEPDTGKIFFDGEKVLGPSEQLIFGHKDFKYVTQDFELMPYITVLENVLKPLSRQDMAKSIKRAKELLDVVGLEDHADQKVKNLSGGQKQRVAIAKALSKTPRLLLLDEPFSHIDNFFKNTLRRKLFSFLKKEKITCIVVTHDKADILPFSDRIMVLKNGKSLAFEKPEQLYQTPGTTYVAGLFGDFNYLNSKWIEKGWPDKTKLIIYPQDVGLKENAINEVQITNQYFMGSFYKIKLKWQEHTIILNHPSKADLQKKYKLTFDKKSILKRNNI